MGFGDGVYIITSRLAFVFRRYHFFCPTICFLFLNSRRIKKRGDYTSRVRYISRHVIDSRQTADSVGTNVHSWPGRKKGSLTSNHSININISVFTRFCFSLWPA